MQADPRYDIGYVSRLTGLSAHLLRAWEKRYGTVTPGRTESNRRLYTEADIERLRLISRLCAAGHRVALLSSLSLTALQRLDGNADSADVRIESALESSQATAKAHVDRCAAAVTALQPERLGRRLRRAAADLSRMSLLTHVLTPLLEGIGQRWTRGEIGIAQEHLAVSVIKGFLLESLRSVGESPKAPIAVAGTPPGQQCELGALMASVVAADSGWRVLYLGPDLPLEEIAAAARKCDAEAVLLSMVMEPRQDELIRDLSRLKQTLGDHVAVHAGGRGLSLFSRRINGLGITVHDDLPTGRALAGVTLA